MKHATKNATSLIKNLSNKKTLKNEKLLNFLKNKKLINLSSQEKSFQLIKKFYQENI